MNNPGAWIAFLSKDLASTGISLQQDESDGRQDYAIAFQSSAMGRTAQLVQFCAAVRAAEDSKQSVSQSVLWEHIEGRSTEDRFLLSAPVVPVLLGRPLPLHSTSGTLESLFIAAQLLQWLCKHEQICVRAPVLSMTPIRATASMPCLTAEEAKVFCRDIERLLNPWWRR